MIFPLVRFFGLVHLSGQFSAGCEAPICRAFLLIHSAFGYGFVESRNIWGLSLGRNFDRKGERGREKRGFGAEWTYAIPS
jgi:hypothetical protein